MTVNNSTIINRTNI